LVYGKGVTLSKPPVPSITTDDIYDPDDPTRRLTDLLAGSVGVEMVGTGIIDATVAGPIPVYTVPVRQSFIPTTIMFALTAISGSGDPPAVSVGVTSDARGLVDSSQISTFALAGGSILDGGYGYVPGDTVALDWGLYSSQSLLTVLSVNAIGAVTAYEIVAAGSYRAVPANPVTTISAQTSLFGQTLYGLNPFGGGHGSGLKLEAIWDEVAGPFVGVETVGRVVSFRDFTQTGTNFKYLTGGQIITVTVDAPATYSSYVLQCLVFGLVTGPLATPAAVLPHAFGKLPYGVGVFG
jgi:hypothetical protein